MRSSQIVAALTGSATALSPAGWRAQSIYQIVTDRFARTDGSTTASCTSTQMGNYCGGTFQGIINKLDYIQGMGFTAIWISPVTAQVSTMTPYGLPYHGYWPQDYYAINSKFGTAAGLKALSSELHGRGMYLMVDVVPNHNAYNGGPGAINFSRFRPFNDPKYFHNPYCPIDYSNQSSMEDCWMGDTTVALPDLKVEDPTVQNMFNAWIQNFVANYSIDGIRIDSAMQINKSFFPGFVSAAGVYAIGEVVNGAPTYLCDYQNYMPGVLNYAYYYWIVRAFSSTSSTMKELANNIPWLRSICKDTTLLGTFVENHDQPRFPSITNDTSLQQNAIAFTLLGDGIPIIYYGQEQGFSGATDPFNREALWSSGYNTTTPMYQLLAKLNFIRNTASSNDPNYATKADSIVYSDKKTMATMKGGVVAVYTNEGSEGAARSISISQSKTGYSANTQYIDILSCKTFTTDNAGGLTVTILKGLPMAIYGATAISGSSVCPGAITQSSKYVDGPANSQTPSAVSKQPTCTSSSVIQFNANITTDWGEVPYIVGSIPQLGSWKVGSALPFEAVNYPIWTRTVTIEAGSYFEYKFIKAADRTKGAKWETGANRNYTVPASAKCVGEKVTLFASWRK